MMVIKNRQDEMVLARIQNRWQIHIAPVDQHKTTFTCLFGMFAYTRMSFELCNTLSTFQIPLPFFVSSSSASESLRIKITLRKLKKMKTQRQN
ncbi:hypothetical protein CR513_36270, partial [Mucuna pruriens]